MYIKSQAKIVRFVVLYTAISVSCVFLRHVCCKYNVYLIYAYSFIHSLFAYTCCMCFLCFLFFSALTVKQRWTDNCLFEILMHKNTPKDDSARPVAKGGARGPCPPLNPSAPPLEQKILHLRYCKKGKISCKRVKFCLCQSTALMIHAS